MHAEATRAKTQSSYDRRFYGKFRGMVVNNVDVQRLGRIQVSVPEVGPLPLMSWAMPCLPVGGLQMGIFTVPLVGAGVWVEFEQGDPDYPIWTGCYFAAHEVPNRVKEVPPAIPAITLQTVLQNSLQISDLPGPTGGIQIKHGLGAMISITDLGITLTNGRGATITMIGNIVDINNGALTVM